MRWRSEEAAVRKKKVDVVKVHEWDEKRRKRRSFELFRSVNFEQPTLQG